MTKLTAKRNVEPFLDNIFSHHVLPACRSPEGISCSTDCDRETLPRNRQEIQGEKAIRSEELLSFESRAKKKSRTVQWPSSVAHFYSYTNGLNSRAVTHASWIELAQRHVRPARSGEDSEHFWCLMHHSIATNE